MTPVNVGSVVRLAAAYGVDRMWLTGATAPASHPGARKTALGTERYVDVVEGGSAAGAAASAHGQGYQLVGIELAEGAVPLFDARLGADVCLALGHEEHGLSAACLGACDLVAYLPLVGRVGSLNVATAAGIALAEVRRQGWTASPPTAGEESP